MSEHKQGKTGDETIRKLELLMKKAGVALEDRKVVAPALERAEQTGNPAAAMELPDGTIVTGRTTDLMGASSAALLNALKLLANIQDSIDLIAPAIIAPIQDLKVTHLGSRNPLLHIDEVLVALSICAVTNPTAKLALDQLSKLRGCEFHSTVILSRVDEDVFKRLGIHVTMEASYQSARLYHK
jgi:uncharacterized protein (UPF0371 family)